MKGLILSGGAGTRLRPITHTAAKQLVPVANKPVLFYGLEAMRAAGITEVGIVVGDTHAEIEAAVGDGSAFGLAVTYLPQEAPLGLAHAVLISEAFLGDEPFVMYLGDNLLKEGIQPFVRGLRCRRSRRPDPPAEGRRSTELRHRRARRRRARLAARGEAARAAQRPCPGGRLPLHTRRLRQRQGHQAQRPGRARDHRRHPAHGRSRPARRAARGHRLVEGHRQARGHARGQPPRAQHPRQGRPGRAARDHAGGAGAHRPRQPARALHRARPRGHRRRLPAQRHLHRPVHVHQRRRGRRSRRARAFDRPREQPHLAAGARAWPTA